MVAENTINAVQQLLDGAVYVETYQLSFKSIFSHDECPNLEKMQGLRTLEISVRLDWDDIQEVGDQGLREFSITKSFPFAAPALRLYHHVEEEWAPMATGNQPGDSHVPMVPEPAALERRKREAEDRKREEQERASRMERRPECVMAVNTVLYKYSSSLSQHPS
ncbi:hypothetical protein B0H14DRAFT_2595829 [Mycena olivaceomarginata]|nr:hypothetical protein B0H14DRAFT_2595829 [Mycena olivaceomarginata]